MKFSLTGGESILFPGEARPSDNNLWYVGGSGVNALKQIVFPRIFNPTNPSYVGFSENDAIFKYFEYDDFSRRWNVYEQMGFKIYSDTIITTRRVLAGVKKKSCGDI